MAPPSILGSAAASAKFVTDLLLATRILPSHTSHGTTINTWVSCCLGQIRDRLALNTLEVNMPGLGFLLLPAHVNEGPLHIVVDNLRSPSRSLLHPLLMSWISFNTQLYFLQAPLPQHRLRLLPVLHIFEKPVHWCGLDSLRVLFPHGRRKVLIPVNTVVLQQDDNVAFPVPLAGTLNHLGQNEALQEPFKLLPSPLIAQFVKQFPQVLALDSGGAKRKKKVITGLPQLLHGAVGRTVDNSGPVEVQDGPEGRGRVALSHLVFSPLINLCIVNTREHPAQHGVWVLRKQGWLHHEPGVFHHQGDLFMVGGSLMVSPCGHPTSIFCSGSSKWCGTTLRLWGRREVSRPPVTPDPPHATPELSIILCV